MKYKELMMKKSKQRLYRLICILASVALLSGIFCLTATPANADASGEIQEQITKLKEDKDAIQSKIAEIKTQYSQNQSKTSDIIAEKNTIDQKIQLISEQIANMNEQISAYNVLIADTQDQLARVEERYRKLQDANRIRIRAMEEEGQLSYWEVLFRANTFSDFLDRLNMIEEISASDNRHLEELSAAAKEVENAQTTLVLQKAELETTRLDLTDTQEEMDREQEKANALLQKLLEQANDLEMLEAEFRAQEEEFLNQIARKESELNAEKEDETLPPPSTVFPDNGNNDSGGNGISNAGEWLVPCSYTSITSPFGHRDSPTTGASSYHQGVDLDTGTGWPVVATRAGIVTVAGYGNAAGNYVQIDHQDGFTSIYMHLSSYAVHSGQVVSAGQMIGATGSSGVATGDHLHFGIAYNGAYVNPCNYVNLQ